MSIRPIDFNGMIQRTEDVGVIKHQADNKPLVDQANITVQIEHNEDVAAHQVQTTAQSGTAKNDRDAKDEGSGVYVPIGGRKKAKKKSDGKVTKKAPSGGFDIKI